MIYLYILIITIFLVLGNDFSQRKGDKRNKLFFALIIVASLVAGLRYMIGADTANYYDFFISFNSNTLSQTRFRPGYPYLVSFVKSVCDYFFVLQLILALFLNITLYYFIKKHTQYVFFAFLVYFIMYYLEFNTEIQRESIAISFCLISYMFYEKKCYWKTLLFFIIALQFHVSALIALLYPIAVHIKYSSKLLLVSLVFILFVIPSLYASLPNVYLLFSLLINQNNWDIEQFTGQTLNSDLTINYYIIHALKNVILPFVTIFYLERKEKTNLVGFVLIWSALQFLNIYSYGFYRFANYFAPFIWIYFSQFFVVFIGRKLSRIKFISVIMVCIVLLYFYQDHLLRPDGGFISESHYKYERYFPYKSIFSEKLY